MMSVLNTNQLDGMGVTGDDEGIALLLADELDWNDEYGHLKLLQEKINAYISFLENRQYEESYPGKEFRYGVIRVCFLHAPTEKGYQFLQAVQDQVGELGVQIQCEVSE